MGLLQFNGNELMSAAFAKRNLLLGKRFVFPYKREDIREMRRKKREELDNNPKHPKDFDSRAFHSAYPNRPNYIAIHGYVCSLL